MLASSASPALMPCSPDSAAAFFSWLDLCSSTRDGFAVKAAMASSSLAHAANFQELIVGGESKSSRLKLTWDAVAKAALYHQETAAETPLPPS